MGEILKIIESLQDSDYLPQVIYEGKVDLMLGMLGSTILGNILKGKDVVRVGKGVVRSLTGSSIDHMVKNFISALLF